MDYMHDGLVTWQTASSMGGGAGEQDARQLGQLDLVLHAEALEALAHIEHIPADSTEI